MNIPYVIDNRTHKLADVLNGLLSEHKGNSLDVATAYFTVSGFELLQDGLEGLGNFRMLLGIEPGSGEALGLRPDSNIVLLNMRRDVEQLPFTEEMLRLIENLIRFLRKDNAAVRVYEKGILHAKCFIFYSDRPGQQLLFERFKPVVAIVGSSNLTGPGLTSNRELNLAHKALLEQSEAEDREAQLAVQWLSEGWPSDAIIPRNRQMIKSEVGARAIIELDRWFESQWTEARDFKDDLIELLNASKFGEMEYAPYEVYLKALYEYFKDELGKEFVPSGKSAIDLTLFQEHAVEKARKILARYDGVMVADSVGLGKTFIGKKLLEDFAYHLRQKAIVICPASLRNMWMEELGSASISARIISQEEMGQADFRAERHGDADVILIDESHNFRNRSAQRYDNLGRLIAHNNGRGRDGMRKKLILITATPINNDLFDLYNQISLFTQGDRSYFAAAGIGDLQRYFINARRESHSGDGAVALFNLLEEVVIRRTRPFIRQAYPEAVIRKRNPAGEIVEEKVRFPERRLKTIEYDLESTYEGIYDEVVSGIESLQLAPYNLESYKKEGVAVDEFEQGREQALVGIFKSRYLKRFESSIAAFKISVKRALEFQQTFESYILDGKVLRSSDFHKAMRFISAEDEEDDAMPVSRADEIDASEEARAALSELEQVDPAEYDLRKLHEAIQHDIAVLRDMWDRVRRITAKDDAKLERLKKLLLEELKGKKVLLFSYYKDTVRYLFRELTNETSARFLKKLGNPDIRRMDSGTKSKDRQRIIEAFAPESNNRPDWIGTDKEIDILVSTDVLSEGQNLQDCGYLINYDLHWNPTRMVQRAGRIDRIGAKFDPLRIYNMFPEEGLERLLRLVESLSMKIAQIDAAGFLDASVLGETVHPQNFNTLRRIRDEDGTVIDEQERFIELASSEYMLQHLRSVLDAEGKDSIERLPDGIHSGLVKGREKGLFFYFQAEPPGAKGKFHFWKYFDLTQNRILDNRYLIANLIACDKDTPRVVGDYDVFGIQEKIIENILQTHQEQRGMQAVPKVVDPAQQVIATSLQGYLNHPDVSRQKIIQAIRFLNKPLSSPLVKELKRHHTEFLKNSDIASFIRNICSMADTYGSAETGGPDSLPELRREHLRLICFDHVCS